jgi:DNA topoisomerase-1
MKQSDYASKQVFVANFWKSFRRLLKGRNKELLLDFSKCNFDNIFAFTEAEREKKKSMTHEARTASLTALSLSALLS